MYRCRRMFGNANKEQSAEAEVAALALNTGISVNMQRFIKEKLEALKSGTAEKVLPFTTGFGNAHYDYVRTVCQDLGLGCEDLPKGGVKAFVRDA